MSKIITILEKMASDSTLKDDVNITHLISEAEITKNQQQAILTRDVNQLSDSISKFPKIIAYVQILPADDDAPYEEEQEGEDESSNKLLTSYL